MARTVRKHANGRDSYVVRPSGTQEYLRSLLLKERYDAKKVNVLSLSSLEDYSFYKAPTTSYYAGK